MNTLLNKMSEMKRIISFCWLLVPVFLWAQPRQMVSPQLQATIDAMQENEEIDLYLRGDIEVLQNFVKSNGGRVKATIKNIVSCRLPVSKINELNHVPQLEFIEFSNSKPHVLNDVMVFNNNINPIHLGVSPLPQAYFGDDVIIGIVDTGIELAHPDFQHPDGSTRVIALWDQTQDEEIAYRVPQPYGYGQEWNAEDINANITGHQDQPSQFGHGTTVAGVAASNGLATGSFAGVAPQADLIIVSSNLNRPNWSASVAEAIDFIFKKAEGFGKPAVVNLSLGDYYGSHDALDAPTIFVEELLDELPGRAVVAAIGNSGNIGNYHLSYDIPEVDTAFTWFKYNNSAQAVLFELWADTAHFNETSFAIGADLTVPNYEFRGYSVWRTAQNNLNEIIVDTIFYNGQKLGIVETWMGLRGEQYNVQIKVTEPFSNQYVWRLSTTGGGKFDCWSYEPFGTSKILEDNLPGWGQYLDMQFYKYPDNAKTIVDSWVCSEKVIAVGNYINRNSFTNYLGQTTSFNDIPGEISKNCSRGPTRDNRQKPDVAASGDHTLSAGKISVLNSWKNIEPNKVAQDGMHYINGGTSIASPVVAGVVALYFSRDNSATYQDVKNAITQNALADFQTGILPGNQFGYGKLNAFAALTEPFGPSTYIDQIYKSQTDIFPNPASNLVSLKWSETGIENITIFDLTGRAVMQKTIGKNREGVQFDVSNLPSGVYIVAFAKNDKTVSRQKLVVEK